MEALIAYFAKEGLVILRAPATFSVALVLCVGIAWATIGWAYSARFDGQASTLVSLEGRLKLKDDQIADYRDKLSGASPDEAKKRIATLELAVKALSPRRLIETQKQVIAGKLAGTKGTIAVAQDMAQADAKALAADFALSFQLAGWNVSLPIFGGLSNPPPTGIGLRVYDPKNLDGIELAVKQALDAAGIQFDLQPGRQKRPDNPNRPAGFPSLPPEMYPDVELILTTKIN